MKNATLTILTALIMACNVSEPAGTLAECQSELQEEIENGESLLDELEAQPVPYSTGGDTPIEPGSVEKTDVVGDDLEHTTDGEKDRLITSLMAEVERMASEHADELEQYQKEYDGLLEQFRDTQTKCGETAALLVDLQGICRVNENGIWQTVEVAE